MSPSDPASRGDSPASVAPPDFWRRLLYRWFVEFNPLYLLSAALVLTGCFLLSRGLSQHHGEWLAVAITSVSEVYAFALVGGAALLTRIGHRRPAVILALLFVLYQWDLTLHTETCAYLGAGGAWASAAWLAIFVGKIYALGWALRVRLARCLVAAWIVGGIGLAIGPHLVYGLGARHAGAFVAAWWFALGALYREGALESLDELSAWGRTVLRRATRGAWLVSMTLLGAHVLFWAKDHPIALSFGLPVVPLLHVRRVRSEARASAIVLATLVGVGVLMPGALSISAVLAAAALLLRALSPEFEAGEPVRPGAVAEPPYRWDGAQAWAPASVERVTGVAAVGVEERARAYAAAFSALWLSAWTTRYAGGLWPAHVALLDVGLTIALLATARSFRLRSPLVPLVACYADLVARGHFIPAPRSAVEWGATTIALGFVLLGGSLATSYHLRAVTGGAVGRGVPPDGRPRRSSTAPP